VYSSVDHPLGSPSFSTPLGWGSIEHIVILIIITITIIKMLLGVKQNSFTHLRVLIGTHWPQHSGPSKLASLIGGFVLCWEYPRGPIDRTYCDYHV
jgi:hypothetical protein